MAGDRVPPISPPSLAARSTLTALPSRSPPSVVKARLCCITSNSAAPSCREVTVRHTPSTATLAPICSPASKPEGNERRSVRKPLRSVIFTTCATPWTMPVNMA